MQYYILDEISPNTNAPFIELPDEIDMIDTIMGNTPFFDELPIRIEAEIEDDVLFTDMLNPGVPLFSGRLKEALEEEGVSCIEYYPVHIINEDNGRCEAEYWLAIIKEIIACIDLQASEFAENSMGKEVITRFSIDEKRCAGASLFRFHNIPGLIIVDESLKQSLKAKELLGVTLKHTREYYQKP